MIDRGQTTCCERCRAAIYVGEGRKWVQEHVLTGKTRIVVVCNRCFRSLAKRVILPYNKRSK